MTGPGEGAAVVIGGGIAGLATAALLAREGYRVSLVEARIELGGRVGSWERDGFRFDTGPSWYLMPEVFEHFYRLLGTSTEKQLNLTKLDPGYRVFFEKHRDPVDIVADVQANVDTFDRIEEGAGPALRRYLDSATDTFQLALQRFLYSTFASFRPLINPAVLKRGGRLGRLLAQPLDKFIARSFTDVRLRQILGYPAVFLGSSPSLTPSLYHLMSHLDLKDGVFYPTGGFTELIQSLVRLAEAEGVEILTGARVSAITTSETGRPRVTGVQFTDTSGASRRIAADLVVSAADLHHTENTLLPENLRTYPEKWWRTRVAGPGAVLVYLGVSGALPELAHHSLFFTDDWAHNFGSIFNEPTSVPSPASVYVCRPSATDPTVAPIGHENLFVLVPVPADPGIGGGGMDGTGDRTVENVADEVIRQLGDWAKIPDLAEPYRRAPNGGPRGLRTRVPVLEGQCARARPHAATERLPPGEERIRQGRRARLRRWNHHSRDRLADVSDQCRTGDQEIAERRECIRIVGATVNRLYLGFLVATIGRTALID